MIVSGSQAAMAQSAPLHPLPPYHRPPGETIDYAIELINNGGAIATAEVGVDLPEGWKQTLRSGGWNAQAISVLPREKKSLNLKVELPFDIEKGLYTFRVTARGHSVLPLTVEVSEQGTVKTVFTADQANMQGHATSNFNYRTKLENQTGEKQLYAFSSHAPRGWTVVLSPTPAGHPVEIERGQSKDIQVEVKDPTRKAGGHTIRRLPAPAAHRPPELEADVWQLRSRAQYSSGRLREDHRRPSQKHRTGGTQQRLHRPEQLRMSAGKPQDGGDHARHHSPIAAGESAEVKAQVRAYDKSIPATMCSISRRRRWKPLPPPRSACRSRHRRSGAGWVF